MTAITASHIRSAGLSLLTAASLLVASCAPFHARNFTDAIWERPIAYDGQVIDAVIYPYDLDDLAGDDAYAFCVQPCDGAAAGAGGAYVTVSTPDRFKGFRGNRAVRLKMQFDASCFAENAVCNPHFPYAFRELP